MPPAVRTSRCRFLVPLGAVTLLLSGIGHTAHAQPERVFADSLVRADFDVLTRALAEAHGGYGRHASRSAVDAQLATLRSGLRGSLTFTQVARQVAIASAVPRDGHLRLEMDSLTVAQLAEARVLPLRVALEGAALVITSNDAAGDTTLRPGMTIERINGRAVRDIIAALLFTISGDGFIETGKRARLGREFATLYWLYIERASRFTIEARDANGPVTRAVLDGVLERERRRVTNDVNRQYAANAKQLDSTTGLVGLELLANGAAARLRVRGFDGAAFPAALDSVFRIVRERRVEHLVLDLRGNGGGVDEYGALLVGHVLDRPFRYFDRIHLSTIAPSFATWPARTFATTKAGTVPDPAGGFLVTAALHSGVGVQQPAAEPYRGQLVVLIDGGTFSTAADVAAQLRSTGRARFVGEETGGGYEGNTSALNAMIVLPNTGLRLKIMMYDYWNAVTPPKVRSRGTMADAEVMTRVADVLRGDDVALTRALRLMSIAAPPR
jgi:hypothetical protein